jgi:nucleoside-diphosphate-sugar epimerase
LTEDSLLREQVLDAEYDKIGVEAALRELELPVTVLRLSGVHGPGDFQHRLWSYLKRMDDGRPVILLDEAMASWRWARVYVEDAAHATALAATNETAAGTTFNVAAATAAGETEWIAEIGHSVGWRGQIVSAPAALLPDYLRVRSSATRRLSARGRRCDERLLGNERTRPTRRIRTPTSSTGSTTGPKTMRSLGSTTVVDL